MLAFCKILKIFKNNLLITRILSFIILTPPEIIFCLEIGWVYICHSNWERRVKIQIRCLNFYRYI